MIYTTRVADKALEIYQRYYDSPHRTSTISNGSVNLFLRSPRTQEIFTVLAKEELDREAS